MLTQVADGVFVHESEFCQSNAVVVLGAAGALLVDPGVHEAEVICLADDLSAVGETVVAGFSTHPHWDHLLWHARLGAAPRYSTALAADTARVRLAGGIDAQRFGIPEEVSLDLIGTLTGLADGELRIPWEGPEVRIAQHNAHAPGHAALLIQERGVLIAGDMLSDVLVPMLDLNGTTDPVGDYLAALDLLEGVAAEIDTVIPGHGSIGAGGEVQARIDRDRAYVLALQDGRDPVDPRIGASARPGWEWVIDVHAGQVRRLAR